MSDHLESFAAQWVSDWNSHDMEAILSHYSDDVTFRSPKVARYTEGRTDTLQGLPALRPYFSSGLNRRTALRFDPVKVCVDADGLALVYTGEDGSTVVETMTLDQGGKVSTARVFYNPAIG